MLDKIEGRNELQLKNRYNGTLKLVEKRVLQILQQEVITKSIEEIKISSSKIFKISYSK